MMGSTHGAHGINLGKLAGARPTMNQTISDFRKGVKFPSFIKGVQKGSGAGGVTPHGASYAESGADTMADNQESAYDADIQNKIKSQLLNASSDHDELTQF